MVETRLASASKGTNLTTTLALIPLQAAGRLLGNGLLSLTARNLSTAVVVRYALNPRLTVLLTSNGGSTFTDVSDNAQDGSTSTDITLSSLPASPTGRIYVGSPIQVRGFQADVDAANGTASVLTGEFWNGSAWTDLSITDGTASGGAAFAVDGNITFTVPTTWVAAPLATILSKTLSGPRFNATNAPLGASLYWARLNATVAYDSATTLNSLLPLNRSTLYNEIIASLPEDIVIQGERHGAVEALTDAGTADLLVSVSGNFAA